MAIGNLLHVVLYDKGGGQRPGCYDAPFTASPGVPDEAYLTGHDVSDIAAQSALFAAALAENCERMMYM